MRLIDADKLKQHYAWWNNEEQRTFDQIVDAQPTVETVVHGKWVNVSDEDWAGGGKTECCNCNYGYAWDAYFEVEDFKYCPNCGAKMDGGDHDAAD